MFPLFGLISSHEKCTSSYVCGYPETFSKYRSIDNKAFFLSFSAYVFLCGLGLSHPNENCSTLPISYIRACYYCTNNHNVISPL